MLPILFDKEIDWECLGPDSTWELRSWVCWRVRRTSWGYVAVVAQSFERKEAAKMPKVLEAASVVEEGMAVAPISEPVNLALKNS